MTETLNKTSADGFFTVADLNEELVDAVACACAHGLLSIGDVFALGMSQHDQENWEDGEKIIDHLEWLIGKAQIEGSLAVVDRTPIQKAIDEYRYARAEAKADAAADMETLCDEDGEDR